MTKKANPIQFLREVRQETEKVTWPSAKETKLTTIMVMVMAVLVSIFLFVTDEVLSVMIQWILGIGK